MPITYDDSFGSVAFRILQRDNEEQQDALVNVRKIPGGSNTYVDLGGSLPPRRQYVILVQDDATWDALRAKVGTQATFVDSVRGTSTAILMGSLTRERFPSGVSRVRAEFLIV